MPVIFPYKHIKTCGYFLILVCKVCLHYASVTLCRSGTIRFGLCLLKSMNSVFQATDTVELCGLTIKQEILDPMSLFSQNDRIQHFMPVSLYKI